MKYIKDLTNLYQEQDSYVFWPICLSVLIALSVVSLWAFYYFSLPREIPIFYSLPWGDSQFGHINQFVLFPSLIILIILINLITSWHLHFSQILIKRVLAIASLIMSVLLSVAAFKIIFTFT